MKAAQNFIRACDGKSVLLLTHHNADPDSLCSAIALFEAVKKFNGRPKIGVVSSASRLSQKIATELGYEYEEDPSFDVDMIILVDASTQGQLFESATNFELSTAKKLIIDHHSPQKNAMLKADHAYFDESKPSTTLIIYEILSGLKFELTKKVAKAIIYGILTDTAHLKFAKTETLGVIFDLCTKFKFNFQDIVAGLTMQSDISERIARLKAAQRIETTRVGDYLIATSSIRSFEASAARAFISLGADVAAVAAVRDEEIRISLRSTINFARESGVNLGKDIISKIGVLIGGSGGGHETAAGANGTKTEKKDEALALVAKLISEKLKVKKHD